MKKFNWQNHDIIPHFNINNAYGERETLKRLRESSTLFENKIVNNKINISLRKQYVCVAAEIDEIVKKVIGYFELERNQAHTDFRNCALPIIESR